MADSFGKTYSKNSILKTTLQQLVNSLDNMGKSSLSLKVFPLLFVCFSRQQKLKSHFDMYHYF